MEPNRSLSRTLTLLVACFALGGCAAAVVGGAAAGGYYVGQDERTAGQIARDAEITARVKTRLARDDQVKALQVNVDTRNFVVYLNGQVDSAVARERAAELAAGVEGVTEVRNRLEVR